MIEDETLEAEQQPKIVNQQEDTSVKDDSTSVEEQNTEEKQDETLSDLFGKPEEYDFNKVELPEGVVLDDEMTSELKKLSVEMNLSQKGADKLMTLGIAQVSKIQKFIENQQKEQIENFKLSLNADKEIGGANLKQSLSEANIAYKEFADDEVKNIFEKTGLNFHPSVVKMFKNIGEQMKDDTIHGTGGDKKQRTANDWFPSMKAIN